MVACIYDMIDESKIIRFKKLNSFIKPKSVQLFQYNNKAGLPWLILGLLSGTLLSGNVF